MGIRLDKEGMGPLTGSSGVPELPLCTGRGRRGTASRGVPIPRRSPIPLRWVGRAPTAIRSHHASLTHEAVAELWKALRRGHADCAGRGIGKRMQYLTQLILSLRR